MKLQRYTFSRDFCKYFDTFSRDFLKTRHFFKGVFLKKHTKNTLTPLLKIRNLGVFEVDLCFFKNYFTAKHFIP